MPTFGLTWDYRCPFARIAHETVLDALEGGAPWDVTFIPFSLAQAHLENGEPDVWDHPETDSALLALQVGVVVRDRFPGQFVTAHRALFEARHAEGRAIRDPDVLADVLRTSDVDPDAVFAEIEGGWPLDTVRKEHEQAESAAGVWGVPTFVVGDQAVFVRLMEGTAGDAELAAKRIERIVALIDEFPELNEYKFTRLLR